MKLYMNKYLAFFSVCFALLATGCGGGGSGGADGGGGAIPPATPVSKTFSVSLENIDARRISNGEAISIQVSGVTSGTLTYEP